MPDFSDTERRLIDLLEVGVIIFLPKIWCFKIKVVFLPRYIKLRFIVHVNETIVIKSSSPKMAEWVKRLKAHKAEQLEKLRNVEKCDFEFQF